MKNKIVAIVSPPYEEAQSGGGINKRLIHKQLTNKDRKTFGNRTFDQTKGGGYQKELHGQNQDNIGNLKAEHNQELDFDITKYHKCLSDLYWFGCYEGDSHFKQYFEPSTYAHPAKISPLLADRIFKHLEKLELLKEGMTVLDFMAGSGRIPLMASLRGYKGLGVELEPHFVKMCNDNKKFAENKIGRKLDMTIVQGDSRQLSKLLNKSDVAVVSPPFETQLQYTSDKYNPEKYAPFVKGRIRFNQETGEPIKYSDNPSNIGNLKYKEMVGVVSPPFVDQNSDNKKYGGLKDISKVQRKNSVLSSVKYSQNPENIGNLKDTGSIVGITSPPKKESEWCECDD